MTVTRRSVLATGAGAGVISAVGWDAAFAQAGTRTRFGATTCARQADAREICPRRRPDDGQQQVSADRSAELGLPMVHALDSGAAIAMARGVKAKKNMLDQVFAGKPPNDPHRLLAQAMWDDCQAHGTNPNDPNFFQETYFCVWHRLYVYYFEEIIRGVLHDPTFTLPYWDYLSGAWRTCRSRLNFGSEQRASAVPQESQRVGQRRRPHRQAQSGRAEPELLQRDFYIDSPDGSVGFCPLLDQNPHGHVHVLVGTPTTWAGCRSRPAIRSSGCTTAISTACGKAGIACRDEPIRRGQIVHSRSRPKRNAMTVTAGGASRVAQLNYQYDKYYVPKKVVPMPAPVAALAAAAATKRRCGPPRTGEVSLANARVDVPLQLAAAHDSGSANSAKDVRTFRAVAPALSRHRRHHRRPRTTPRPTTCSSICLRVRPMRRPPIRTTSER